MPGANSTGLNVILKQVKSESMATKFNDHRYNNLSTFRSVK